jgi:asparagine synthase (glutamine-hydrolysing)
VPGIVGLITKMPREWAEPQLLRMVDALRHESFYETGTFIDESLGVYCGWAALKNSFADGMPVLNERGDVSLVFSGEEYSDPEVAQGLKQRGHSLTGKRSSYLVHLSEEDPNFPACLNGMFHGLLADRTGGTATLFNDRYGMHRVYYHESKEAFYFAGEAKAILAVRPELRTPSPQGLGEFVACSCVLENRTIFKDIFVLPAASAWVFRNKALERKGTYFEPREWEQQDSLDPETYYQELRNALSRSLENYFAGPERTGIALTGGMDTRVIMAWHKAASGSLPCYTFGGMFRECQDVRLARKVASACQQTHQVIEVGDDFLRRFPHYAARSVYLTEGGVDVYRASDLYVSEKAREIAPAKVVGTYGSEIVRHAVMFKPMPLKDGLFRPEFLAQVHQAGETYRAIRRVHPVTFAAFRQSPWYHHGILALEQTQLTVRSPYLDNNFVRTVFRAPTLNNGNGDVRLRLTGDGSRVLRRIPSDRGLGGASGPLMSAISRGFLEFTFKAEYAYDYGMPQGVARIDHLFSALRLERLFLGRHKFLHYRVWYRDALAKYVREMLLDPLTLSRPYLERKGLEEIVNGHLRGDRNYTTEIHKMLTLELLHRQFFDSGTAGGGNHS